MRAFCVLDMRFNTHLMCNLSSVLLTWYVSEVVIMSEKWEIATHGLLKDLRYTARAFKVWSALSQQRREVISFHTDYVLLYNAGSPSHDLRYYNPGSGGKREPKQAAMNKY